jgi:hypothetical protein
MIARIIVARQRMSTLKIATAIKFSGLLGDRYEPVTSIAIRCRRRVAGEIDSVTTFRGTKYHSRGTRRSIGGKQLPDHGISVPQADVPQTPSHLTRRLLRVPASRLGVNLSLCVELQVN